MAQLPKHTHPLFAQDLLGRSCYPVATAYYFRQWDGFRMAFHHHNDTEIMYIISGKCQVEVDAHGGEEAIDSVSLKKGEFIMLNAIIPHRLIVDEAVPCRMLNIEFRFMPGVGLSPTVQRLAAEDDDLRALLDTDRAYLVLRDPGEVYPCLKSLVLELDQRDAGGAMVHMQLMQLLIHIGRLNQEKIASGDSQTNYYVKASIAYLHQNYDRDIQVKDIAAAVNLHPGYLHRIFKSFTGKTLTQYLTELRMEKAKMLLLHSDIPILDICDYVGVASRQYFHSLFKKYTDLTPAEYRRSMHAHTMLRLDES